MIRSFRSEATEGLFKQRPGAYPAEWEPLFLRRLWLLDSAVKLDDLKALPTAHVETLSGGSHKGYHRMRLAGPYHLYFWWMDGDAYKVEIHAEA